MPFESSNIAGAWPIFPDCNFENWPWEDPHGGFPNGGSWFGTLEGNEEPLQFVIYMFIHIGGGLIGEKTLETLNIQWFSLTELPPLQ